MKTKVSIILSLLILFCISMPGCFTNTNNGEPKISTKTIPSTTTNEKAVATPIPTETTPLTTTKENAIAPSIPIEISNEEKGVPDSVVLSYSELYADYNNRYDTVNYDIMHNIDTDAHIDSVVLFLGAETTYATHFSTISYDYQYHQSDDLWSLLAIGEESESYTFNDDAFIGESPWIDAVEDDDYDHGFFYTVYIDELDTTALTATIRYGIDFMNPDYNNIKQETPLYVDLIYQPYMDTYLIIIDTSGSGYFDDSIWFALLPEGLKPVTF